MGRLFLYAVIIVVCIALFLFFPFVFETDIHYDVNGKKLGFAVYFYGILKIIGGYISTYSGGIAFHISQKKVLLEKYSDIERERKRFSFVKSFKLIGLNITTETGAEYLLPLGIMHSLSRIYFFIIGGKKENIENNLWLTDGDILRISSKVTVYFNLYILLVELLKFIKEKSTTIWKRKKKKSIA